MDITHSTMIHDPWSPQKGEVLYYFFSTFENGQCMDTLLPIRYILWVQCQKSGEFCCARASRFSFSKNHREQENTKLKMFKDVWHFKIISFSSFFDLNKLMNTFCFRWPFSRNIFVKIRIYLPKFWKNYNLPFGKNTIFLNKFLLKNICLTLPRLLSILWLSYNTSFSK